MNKPEDVSQEDWEKLIQDEKIMIDNFQLDKPYPIEIIRKLNYNSNKESCMDYNDNLDELIRIRARIDNFQYYISLISKN